MKQVFGIASCVLCIFTGACARSHSGSPTAPTLVTPAPPSPSPQSYVVAGLVSTMTASGSVPVAGALVTVNSATRAVTDSDGFYEIRGTLATPTARLRAQSLGYATDERTFTAGADTRVDFNLLPVQTYTLSGVLSELTDAGTVPAQGVVVQMGSCQDPPTCELYRYDSLTTDRTGAYFFSGIFAGTNSTAITLTKDGKYYIEDRAVSNSCDGCFRVFTVTGDTRMDILLRTPPQ